MNAYFFKMNREEKDNILDQHKQLYDGYVTRYNQESNQTPLYTQDLANDKNGITVSNKGVIKNYTNMNINEAMLDTIGDGSNDLKNGTVDLGHEMMHDVYPSPNEDENEEYVSFGEYAKDMGQNLDQYEYDIDELEDYSAGELGEMYDDELDSEFEYPEFEVNGEEEEIVGEIPKFDWLRTHQDLDEDDAEQVVSKITESLDMFKRFKKYN